MHRGKLFAKSQNPEPSRITTTDLEHGRIDIVIDDGDTYREVALEPKGIFPVDEVIHSLREVPKYDQTADVETAVEVIEGFRHELRALLHDGGLLFSGSGVLHSWKSVEEFAFDCAVTPDEFIRRVEELGIVDGFTFLYYEYQWMNELQMHQINPKYIQTKFGTRSKSAKPIIIAPSLVSRLSINPDILTGNLKVNQYIKSSLPRNEKRHGGNSVLDSVGNALTICLANRMKYAYRDNFASMPHLGNYASIVRMMLIEEILNYTEESEAE